jgi:hypothetical protein
MMTYRYEKWYYNNNKKNNNILKTRHSVHLLIFPYIPIPHPLQSQSIITNLYILLLLSLSYSFLLVAG